MSPATTPTSRTSTPTSRASTPTSRVTSSQPRGTSLQSRATTSQLQSGAVTPSRKKPSDKRLSAATLARIKHGEVEREAEPVICEEFVLTTCGCQLAGGGPCSSMFSSEYYQQYRAQALFLSKELLDMALIGSIAATVCEDDDVGVRSGHRPAKRQRTTIQYMHKGYQVCQNTYNFLHSVGKRKVHNIKEHFLENGLVEREHGNTKNRPHNALTFARITNILKFIENYAEKHAILLPGRIPGFKRDDVSVLPTSDSKQVISL